MEENLDVFLADFGLDVQFGDICTKGIFDMPDQNILGGQVTSTEYSLTFKTEDIPLLKNNDALSVDEINYKVREIEKIADGKFTRATLTKI